MGTAGIQVPVQRAPNCLCEQTAWKNKWTKNAWIHHYFHILFPHIKLATGYSLTNCLIPTYIFNLGVMNKTMENLKHMTFCQVCCSSEGYMTTLNQSPLSPVLYHTQSVGPMQSWENATVYKSTGKTGLQSGYTELWGGTQVDILPA